MESREIQVSKERLSISQETTFEIMYADLNAKARIRLCELFNTHPSLENWDVYPLALVDRKL